MIERSSEARISTGQTFCRRPQRSSVDSRAIDLYTSLDSINSNQWINRTATSLSISQLAIDLSWCQLSPRPLFSTVLPADFRISGDAEAMTIVALAMAFLRALWPLLALATNRFVFTRESSYCFQRVLAIAILSVCLSVRPFVTRVDQSKTVQARIIKSSPSAAGKTNFRNRKAFP